METRNHLTKGEFSFCIITDDASLGIKKKLLDHFDQLLGLLSDVQWALSYVIYPRLSNGIMLRYEFQSKRTAEIVQQVDKHIHKCLQVLLQSTQRLRFNIK